MRHMAKVCAGVVLAMGAAACGQSSPPAPAAAPAAAPTSHVRLYVSDETGGNVDVIDPASGQVLAKIAVGKRPRGIKISQDGKTLYVALSGSPIAGPGVDESTLPPA